MSKTRPQDRSDHGLHPPLMEVAAPLAREGGFEPDVIVCADDVSRGRPAPWMVFRAPNDSTCIPCLRSPSSTTPASASRPG